MIEVWMDWVSVFGQRVERPSFVSRSAWMAYWEKVARTFREP